MSHVPSSCLATGDVASARTVVACMCSGRPQRTHGCAETGVRAQRGTADARLCTFLFSVAAAAAAAAALTIVCRLQPTTTAIWGALFLRRAVDPGSAVSASRTLGVEMAFIAPSSFHAVTPAPASPAVSAWMLARSAASRFSSARACSIRARPGTPTQGEDEEDWQRQASFDDLLMCTTRSLTIFLIHAPRPLSLSLSLSLSLTHTRFSLSLSTRRRWRRSNSSSSSSSSNAASHMRHLLWRRGASGHPLRQRALLLPRLHRAFHSQRRVFYDLSRAPPRAGQAERRDHLLAPGLSSRVPRPRDLWSCAWVRPRAARSASARSCRCVRDGARAARSHEGECNLRRGPGGGAAGGRTAQRRG